MNPGRNNPSKADVETGGAFSPGYNSGSEINGEICGSIPGPPCFGDGLSMGADPENESYVHIHRGMQGMGNLRVGVYDWRNPVARFTVTRVRGKKGD